MSLIIKVKKRCLDNETKKVRTASKETNNVQDKSTNFGGLSIGWIVLIPCVSQAYFLAQIENHLDPHLLNIYPYNWYIYIIHFLNPTMMALPMAAYYYSKSKELRRAVRGVFLG